MAQGRRAGAHQGAQRARTRTTRRRARRTRTRRTSRSSPTRSRSSRDRAGATRSSPRSRPRTPTRRRPAFAQALVQFPSDPRIEPAFLAAYKKLTWDASVELLGPLKPRAALAQASASFYDANLTDWLVKEMARGARRGEQAPAARGGDQADAAREEGRRGRGAAEGEGDLPADVFQASKQMFDFAASALDKCGDGRELLPRRRSTSPSRRRRRRRTWRAVKAAWMAVIYGRAARGASARRAPQARRQGEGRERAPRHRRGASTSWRRAATSPTADALDKIVAADTKAGDKGVLMADDSVVKIALRLRARATP